MKKWLVCIWQCLEAWCEEKTLAEENKDKPKVDVVDVEKLGKKTSRKKTQRETQPWEKVEQKPRKRLRVKNGKVGEKMHKNEGG